MVGSNTGVMAKIGEEVLEILQNHCVAHELELAILDAVQEMPILKRFEETIVLRREVKAIATVLDEDMCHFSSIKEVRGQTIMCGSSYMLLKIMISSLEL